MSYNDKLNLIVLIWEIIILITLIISSFDYIFLHNIVVFNGFVYHLFCYIAVKWLLKLRNDKNLN